MTAAGSTIGVEEEYHLVDGTTFRLADAPEVVDEARAALGPQAQGEISTSQLEIATPVCSSLAELRTELARLRRGADLAARAHGCRVLASGTHPVSTWAEQRLTPEPRYLELFDRWGMLALQQMIAGCHVHVSVPPELAVGVLDHLRPDLPVLIALAGSSPFWEGHDTGYASYRTQWFARWPVTGPPEPFASREEYDRTIADLVTSGVADDASHLYWDVRPSTRYPTVEVRVADTMPRLDDVVLHAGLARALVTAAARAVEGGEPPVVVRPEVLRAARWRAARYGLEGELLDLRARALVPAAGLVGSTLDRLRPDLEAAGEWDEVSALAADLLARGSSATRQRQVALRAGDLDAVTAALCDEALDL